MFKKRRVKRHPYRWTALALGLAAGTWALIRQL
jgi:hypothetical protein